MIDRYYHVLLLVIRILLGNFLITTLYFGGEEIFSRVFCGPLFILRKIHPQSSGPEGFNFWNFHKKWGPLWGREF